MKSLSVAAAVVVLVAFRASAAISGFVYYDDGTPAANVRVAAYRFESWRDTYVRLLSPKRERVAVAAATTNERGAWSLDVPADAPPLVIEVDDAAIIRRRVPYVPGEPIPVLLINRIPSREGVVTSDGKPVAGATLFWRGESASYETRTDAAGKFRVPD